MVYTGKIICVYFSLLNMNKDLKQILEFSNCKLQHSICIYDWQENESGTTPEEAYIQITSYGKKVGSVTNKQELIRLLNCKASRDMHKEMWTKDLRDGIFTVQEFEDIPENILFDSMKDVVKTSSRIQLMDEKEKGEPINLENAFCNRNWFMDKLNIKLPPDAEDCQINKEEFWKTGRYLKR